MTTRNAYGGNAARIENSITTTTTSAPRQIVMTIGTCKTCHRKRKRLANGRCEDCRFFAVPATEAKRQRDAAAKRTRNE